MRVHRIQSESNQTISFELLDDTDRPIEIVSGFMRHLRARNYSPNTLSAYAHDLLHFMTFLKQQQVTYQDFTPPHAFLFLEYLTAMSHQKPIQRLGLVLSTTTNDGSSTTRLSPATINRIFAAVSSFYEYLKTVQHLPRPMEDDHVNKLLESFQLKRDRAMILLMLHGGLRPGEVLNLHLEDLQYGRRRVIIRYRTDHPKGVRTKSRTERVVDLYQPETLQSVSDYVMHERPSDVDSPYVFLVGGRGTRRGEPLGYHALVKLFERHCERLQIRNPWVTPHALRHTHATKMWEGGMRELALQKRLGHASPESTRIYTQVSDPLMVAEYQRALGEEET